MKNINIGSLTLRNPEDPEIFQDESFEMTDDFIPRKEWDIITAQNDSGGTSRILTNGNLMLLIAPIGTGKTSVVQSWVAGCLNKSADTLGFKINIGPDEKVLQIDTERSRNDLKRGWEEIKRRASMDRSRSTYFEGNNIRRFKLVSFKFLKTQKSFIEHFRYHATQGYRIIFIDVITDFLSSVNNEEEARELVIEMMQIAEDNDCALVITIHPNPKDADYKARGHIGTVLQQKAESVFACFRADDDTTIITSDPRKFTHGKVRSGSPRVSSAYMWDTTKGYHASAFLSEELKAKINKEYLEYDAIIEEMYEIQDSYTEGEILEFFRAKLNNMELTFDPILEYFQQRGTMEVNGFDGKYQRKSLSEDKLPF